jgi:hypothetical protein
MSHVRGRIAVDVQFTDSTTSAGVQSLKTITMQDATEYTSGKVAIVTGTVGTAGATISPSSGTGYKNAAGDEIFMSSGVSRVAFSASPFAQAVGDEGGEVVISRSARVAITEQVDVVSNQQWIISTTSGTASYTMVLYGT